MALGYTIHIEAKSPDVATELIGEQVEKLMDLFAATGGSVSALPRSVGVTFSITAPDVVPACTAGARLFRKHMNVIGYGDWDIVRLEAETFEEHDAALARPAFPELVGVAELAQLFGVAPQRASALQHRDGFPAPVATLKSGPVWVRANVEDFAKTWVRKPGRPAKGDVVGVESLGGTTAREVAEVIAHNRVKH